MYCRSDHNLDFSFLFYINFIRTLKDIRSYTNLFHQVNWGLFMILHPEIFEARMGIVCFSGEAAWVCVAPAATSVTGMPALLPSPPPQWHSCSGCPLLVACHNSRSVSMSSASRVCSLSPWSCISGFSRHLSGDFSPAPGLTPPHVRGSLAFADVRTACLL